ncbi:hypothetical protein BVY03_02090 [bacterium K02(2017)]|nr:hypothetical protein BVY03_02090 [bacterium K02(2017)]
MNFQKAYFKKPNSYIPYRYDPEPEDWNELNQIDWQQEIILEVGCGKGKWIIEQAKLNPHKTYIGIERTLNKSKFLLNESLKNLINLRADALAVMQQKIPNKVINEIYFYYPNPMPKRSQANQRFFVSAAFENIDKILINNGKIYLVSNILDYITEAKDFLEQFWGYSIQTCQKLNTTVEPRTDFEAKYQQQGQDLFELTAFKGN